MTPTVRRIRASEWRAWRSLRLRSLREDPAVFGSTYERESAFPDEVWQERTGAAASGADRAMFVAEEGEGLVGCAGALTDEEGVAKIIAVWIAPEARGRGLGARVVGEALAWCRAAGKPFARLLVTADNDTARAVYRRVGFADTGRTAVLDRDPPILELEMEVRL